MVCPTVRYTQRAACLLDELLIPLPEGNRVGLHRCTNGTQAGKGTASLEVIVREIHPFLNLAVKVLPKLLTLLQGDGEDIFSNAPAFLSIICQHALRRHRSHAHLQVTFQECQHLVRNRL